MGGILCGVMIYALLNHLMGIREWVVDEEEPIPA
jgi:hypothetical protein